MGDLETVKDLLQGKEISSMKLDEIADLIKKDWKKVYFGAVPYLDAMGKIDANGMYFADSWQSIVTYFLANTNTWRGPVAKEVKAELKKRLKKNKIARLQKIAALIRASSEEECVICGSGTSHFELDYRGDSVPVCDDFICLKQFGKTASTTKTAGWDGIQTDEDVMDVLEKDYKSIKWVMKDHVAVYGVYRDDFIVALYEEKHEHGDRWVYTKVMDGKMGPFQRPPKKFWEMPEIKQALSEERIEFEKNWDGRR